MTHKLADETLSAILAESISVSDVDFACTDARRSPFMTEALSSSTILLVCKRWLRVATPLLYETVILRSAAQSSALAQVLKKQIEFGRYIRKLRVEGGVGASICKIFKAAPNITDLCLTLDLYADDKVASMYKCLFDSVSPRRLVLCSGAPTSYLNHNKMVTAALDSLVACITGWTGTLRVVTLAVAVLKHPRIYKAVCAAQHLELIHLPEEECSHSEPRWFVSQLADRCAAPVIRVGWPEHELHQLFFLRHLPPKPLSAAAQAKVRFPEPESERPEVVVLPSTSSYTPLSGVSESTRRAIWTLILDLVISHTQGVDISRARDIFKDHDDGGVGAIALLPKGPALQCMSVCKEWKEIVAPLACQNLRFPTMSRAGRASECVFGIVFGARCSTAARVGPRVPG